ncbi:MAG: Methyltransferase type 11 [Thermomicrobiales bacterium]|jgi:SAM-dependent methyltransferase|nr:Methyltransferase type 11 [Thermomicrobiales bacterium]
MTAAGIEGMTGDPYAELPELYDLEHAGFDDDVELYLRLAEVVGDPILELGCGTGRVLAPLAKAGFRVTGVDISGPMLARAEERLAAPEFGDRVQLVQAPMTEADRAPGGPFGMVILSLNGLMHLPTQGEQRAALTAARRALDPRGMLVIDTLGPDLALLATFDGHVQHEGSWERPDGTRVDRFAARTHHLAEQRIDTELWYDLTAADGRVRRVRTRFPMRYVSPAEFELMLELAGFIEWKRYGSYELDPFEDGSDRLIVTAEVTPS